MGEPLGTTRAALLGPFSVAPTIVILAPPAAAKTGGASPTPPMSTAPAPMACSIGGPEEKSDQVALKGSWPRSPAAFSKDSAPVPAWSPIRRVT